MAPLLRLVPRSLHFRRLAGVVMMGVVFVGASALAQDPAGDPSVDPEADPDSEEDSVAAELNRRDRLFGSGDRPLLPKWLTPWQEKRLEWSEEHGLEISISYDSLWQVALGGGDSTSVGSGELALTGSWAFISGTSGPMRFREVAEKNPMSLKFRLRNRHRYLDNAPSDLGGEIGAIWGTTDAFNDHGFEIPDFYIRQYIDRWNLELRYGQLSVDSQLDRYALRGVKQSFLNRAFSTNPAVAFPRFGAGATAQWKVDSGWDVTVAITQVQASKAGDQVDFDLASTDLFYGIQVGHSFDGWGGEPARIQALYWYSDALEETGSPSGHGISTVFEQNLKREGLRLFLRFAHAENEATDASNLFAAGVGQKMREHDLLGIGFGAGESSTTSDRQAVLECFYRWQAGPELHITPDVQVLVGDGFTGGGELRVIPGIRGRLAF